MNPLILVVFVLAAGFFFVLLTRWQRGGKSDPTTRCGCDHDHSEGCDHDAHHSHDCGQHGDHDHHRR